MQKYFIFLLALFLTACVTTKDLDGDRKTIVFQMQSYAETYFKYGVDTDDSKVEISHGGKVSCYQYEFFPNKKCVIVTKYGASRDKYEEVYLKAAEKICQRFGGELDFANNKYCTKGKTFQDVIFKYTWRQKDAWQNELEVIVPAHDDPQMQQRLNNNLFFADYVPYSQKMYGYISDFAVWEKKSDFYEKYIAGQKFVSLYTKFDPDGKIPEINSYLEAKKDEFIKEKPIRMRKAEEVRLNEINKIQVEEERQRRDRQAKYDYEQSIVKKNGAIVCLEGDGSQDQQITWARTRINGRIYFDYTVKGTVEKFNGNQISVRVTSIQTKRTRLSDNFVQIQPVTNMLGIGYIEYPREIMGDPAFIVGQLTWDSPAAWKPCR